MSKFEPQHKGRHAEPKEVRLLRNVEMMADGCWRWKGSTAINGYGQFCFNGKQVVAHRASYELFVGEIPHGLVLDHLCRNRACVNPAHLEPVTLVENSRRASLGKSRPKKTHCNKGHEFTPENTGLAGGRRYCRECSRATSRLRRQRNPTQPRTAKNILRVYGLLRTHPMTLSELEATTNLEYDTVRKAVGKLVLAGKVWAIGKKPRPGICGPQSETYTAEEPLACASERNAEEMPSTQNRDAA